MDDTAVKIQVPQSAAWLGGLGLLPFVALAASLPFAPADLKATLAYALLGYGAVILSFLGGVHWGLAIGSTAPGAAESLKTRLILSVIPSLVAWAALLMPAGGLFVLAAAIALMLIVDLRATRAGHAPAWYPRLRIPLSLAVAISLLAGALL